MVTALILQYLVVKRNGEFKIKRQSTKKSAVWFDMQE